MIAVRDVNALPTPQPPFVAVIEILETVQVVEVPWQPEGLRKERLRLPAQPRQQAVVLGTGTGAVPALVDLLDQLGMLP